MIFSTSLPRFKAFLADFFRQKLGLGLLAAIYHLFSSAHVPTFCRRCRALHPPRYPRCWLAAPLARRLDGTGCSSRCCSEPALACCPRPSRPAAPARHRLHHAWSARPTDAEHLLLPQHQEAPREVRPSPEAVPPPLRTLLCVRAAADPQRPAYSLLAPVLYQAALCHLRTQALHAGRPGSAIDRLPSAGCARRWSWSATRPSRPSKCGGPAHAGTGSG